MPRKKRKKNPSRKARRKNPAKRTRRRSPASYHAAPKAKRRTHRRRRKNPMGLDMKTLWKLLIGAGAGVATGIAVTKAAQMFPSKTGQYGVTAAGVVASALVGAANPIVGAGMMTPVVARAIKGFLPAGLSTGAVEAWGGDDWSGIPYRLGAVEADLGAVEADLGAYSPVESDGYLGDDLQARRENLYSAFY